MMTTYRYVGTATVLSITERKDKDQKSLGWWLRLSESSAIYMGMDKPSMKEGDTVTHIIEHRKEEADVPIGLPTRKEP